MNRRSRTTGRLEHGLERFAARVTQWTGRSAAFGVAVSIIGLWALSGPLFAFSDTWQLVSNTRRLIDVEDLTEDEVRTLHRHYNPRTE